jgi:hypothetical protein
MPATDQAPGMVERADTPWYPSMRLFRQAKRGEWNDVFEAMARELSQRVVAPAAEETSDWLPVLESAPKTAAEPTDCCSSREDRQSGLDFHGTERQSHTTVQDNEFE